MEKCDDVWIYISCKVYENEWNSITRVEMRRCWTNLLHLCVLQDPLLRHLGGGVLWIVRVRSMTSSVLRFFFRDNPLFVTYHQIFFAQVVHYMPSKDGGWKGKEVFLSRLGKKYGHNKKYMVLKIFVQWPIFFYQ